MNVKQTVAGIRWYLREVSGEADYDRYVARAGSQHAEVPVMSRRDFERRKMAERDGNPRARCC